MPKRLLVQLEEPVNGAVLLECRECVRGSSYDMDGRSRSKSGFILNVELPPVSPGALH